MLPYLKHSKLISKIQIHLTQITFFSVLKSANFKSLLFCKCKNFREEVFSLYFSFHPMTTPLYFLIILCFFFFLFNGDSLWVMQLFENVRNHQMFARHCFQNSWRYYWLNICLPANQAEFTCLNQVNKFLFFTLQ